MRLIWVSGLKGGFEVGDNLLLAAHDAGQPRSAFSSCTKRTGNLRGIIGDHEQKRTFLHNVREKQDGGMAAFGLERGVRQRP